MDRVRRMDCFAAEWTETLLAEAPNGPNCPPNGPSSSPNGPKSRRMDRAKCKSIPPNGPKWSISLLLHGSCQCLPNGPSAEWTDFGSPGSEPARGRLCALRACSRPPVRSSCSACLLGFASAFEFALRRNCSIKRSLVAQRHRSLTLCIP